jgi:hypothetical protein
MISSVKHSEHVQKQVVLWDREISLLRVECTHRKQSDMERLIPNGFLLDVCEDTYANQVTFDQTKTCTRSHQTFLNTTKRGAGTKPGSYRGMSR